MKAIASNTRLFASAAMAVFLIGCGGNTRAIQDFAAVEYGLTGPQIWRQLSTKEKKMVLAIQYRTLETAPAWQEFVWEVPKKQLSGRVYAAQPFVVAGLNCRQLAQSVRRAQSEVMRQGTVCRDAAGRWRLLD